MKKPIDLLIYPAFVMAAVLVVNLSPLVIEGPHVPFEELDITNESKIIVARENSTTIAFNDFAPVQISTPTQTAIAPTNTPAPTNTTVPGDTATPLPTPGDTPTFTLVPTNTPSTTPRPTSTRALTFTPGPTSRATSSPTAAATATATVSWATWTATATGTATTTASTTATTKALPTSPGTPSPLLDRLADDKPSIWGKKGFYILLGLVYLTLLGLFLGQVINTLKGRS